MSKIYKINGNEYQVSINSIVGNHAQVQVNGVMYQVEISEKSSSEVAVPKTVSPVSTSSGKPVLSNTNGDKKSVKAPLPGVIVALKAKVGEAVKTGQTVAVLEAMKMENDIQSEYDGVILSIEVNPGDSIMEGATIMTIG